MAVDMVLEHLHGSLIITTFRNNNIRVFLAGLHKLLMHRFHRIHILVDDGFQASGPLENVSLETADQTDIGIGVHEDTHIHHITELFIFKDQDSFHDDHFAGRYGDRVLAPVVDFVIIDRSLNRTSCPQFLQMLNHQLGIKSVRMIVVQIFPLLKGHIVMSLVVVVMFQNRHMFLEQ